MIWLKLLFHMAQFYDPSLFSMHIISNFQHVSPLMQFNTENEIQDN